MKFRHLALSNVRGNWHQYIAFFLSSVFSVLIFFMFAQFIYHPGVVNGTIVAAAKTRQGLVACEYIIIVFSFFFVLYSYSAFLKSRKKEFGLLTMFGMTRGQLNRLVIYENTIIGILAIVAGIGFGALFSKLFFMAMSELLGVSNPIPFQLVPKAVIVTAASFFIVFEAISVLMLFSVGRTSIIELLKAAKKPKTLPAFSKWLVALAVICLGGAYALAYVSDDTNIILFSLPILFLVIVGTYFLYTQASIAVLRWLQHRKSVYYQNVKLLTISSLVFKLKDNARLLFMVSIMSAVVLTASGTLFVFYKEAISQIVRNFPQTFGFIETGLNSHKVLDPAKVKAKLQQDGVDIVYETKLVGIPAAFRMEKYSQSDRKSMLLPLREYEVQLKAMGLTSQLQLQPGQGHYVFPYAGNYKLVHPGDRLPVKVGNEQIELVMEGQSNGAVVPRISYAEDVIVLSNDDYDRLAKSIPDNKKIVVYSYELEDWISAIQTVQDINGMVPKDQRAKYQNRIDFYLDAKQLGSLTSFIGVFVVVLFFIASCSVIYFKLFTEMQEDKELYRSLSRIGVSNLELRKVLFAQMRVIYFAPLAVGVVHATFAMIALGNVQGDNVLEYGAIVMAIFLVLQWFFYLISRSMFTKKLVSN